MGSGRGQSRRASTTISTAEANISGIATNIDAWTDFVHDSDVGSQNLLSYYGLDEPDEDGPTPQGMEELATELFKDLVAMRAIILPSGWGASDFNFRVHSRSSNLVPSDLVLLSQKDKAVHEHVTRNPELLHSHRIHVTFASPETLRLVGNILEAADDIRFSRQK